MQITHLTMTNWGPYRGTHEVNLEVTRESPVILFHGENMRGKTSILRAIVWGLYGELKNQDGKTNLPVSRLANRPELESERAAPVSVKINMVHRGESYELIRSVTAAMNSTGSVETTPPVASLLPANGSPYPTEHISDVISSMLNHDVSDFFFFDGEMLSRFEERLRDDQEVSRPFVKKQIEQALSLPFLKTLETDLVTIQSNVEAEIARVLRSNKKAKETTDKHRAVSDELRKIIQDGEKLVSLQTSHDDELQEIEDQLGRVDAIKDLFYERRRHEEEIHQKNTELQDIINISRGLQDENWWFPLAANLVDEQQRLVDEISNANQSAKVRIKLELEAKGIRNQLSSHTCPTCGHDIDSASDEALEKALHELEDAIAGLPEITGGDDVRERLSKLRKYSSGTSIVSKIVQNSKDALRARLYIDRAESRIRDIDEELAGNTVDISSLESRRRSLKDQIGKIKLVLDAQTRKREDLRGQLSRLSTEMAKNPEVADIDRSRLQVLTSAIDIVRESYTEFSNQMRFQVENEASSLFRRLTTEKSYSGVSISPDYSLRILDSQGATVELASAGGNQILTMAFIGALGACSSDEAPMVMDTPFGRLDMGHREGILRWVSEFESQIIMFVQSGEYDRTRDGQYLKNRIGREYQILRVSDRESRILKEGHDDTV